MPLDFTFSTRSTVNSGTDALAEQAQDWRAVWPGISGCLAQAVGQQFEAEGGRGPHDRWAPLSDAYARRKQKLYPGRPLLQASGRLWQSLVGKTQDTAEEYESGKLRFGTRVAYAAYIQSGRGKVSQRMIFDLQLEDVTAVKNQMELQALQIARGAGFGLAQNAPTAAGSAGASRMRGTGSESTRSIAGEPARLSGGL